MKLERPAADAVSFGSTEPKDRIVKGTKKNKAKQIEPTATYWGSCWAVIGLAETLPRRSAE